MIVMFFFESYVTLKRKLDIHKFTPKKGDFTLFNSKNVWNFVTVNFTEFLRKCFKVDSELHTFVRKFQIYILFMYDA